MENKELEEIVELEKDNEKSEKEIVSQRWEELSDSLKEFWNK